MMLHGLLMETLMVRLFLDACIVIFPLCLPVFVTFILVFSEDCIYHVLSTHSVHKHSCIYILYIINSRLVYDEMALNK